MKCIIRIEVPNSAFKCEPLSELGRLLATVAERLRGTDSRTIIDGIGNIVGHVDIVYGICGRCDGEIDTCGICPRCEGEEGDYD